MVEKLELPLRNQEAGGSGPRQPRPHHRAGPYHRGQVIVGMGWCQVKEERLVPFEGSQTKASMPPSSQLLPWQREGSLETQPMSLGLGKSGWVG